MTKDRTPRDWRRIGRLATGSIVGSIAAIASFDHQRSLAMSHGQNKLIGTLLPLSVDVLILCATFAMDGRNRFWPRVGFWIGVGATISANVLAAPPDLLSQLISAWAPVALLIVIEIEARRNKTERWKIRKAVEPVAEAPASNTEAVEIGTAPPASNADGTAEVKPRTRNSRGEATAKKVVKTAAKNPDAPLAVIAAKAGVSESTARRYVPPVATPEPITEPTPAAVT